MTKTLPLFLGFIILGLLSVATRYFKVRLDLRRLALLAALSFLLGYMLFYTAAWRLLISGVRMLTRISILGLLALVAAVFLAMKAEEERKR